jgi:ketosteroid isomerase-like protein
MSESELLQLTQELLEAISRRDWDAYARMCDLSLTCFEPETEGRLVPGLAFHRYYFTLAQDSGPRQVTIADPHVRLIGDTAAVVCYTRLIQHLDAQGHPQTSCVSETRIWQRTENGWKHVHFHRSP